MGSTRAGSPGPGAPRPSDDEIRAVAAQLAAEHGEQPTASPGSQLSAQEHELAPADEERVSDALAELGAVDPDTGMRAEREAAGEPEPRPTTWALDDDARGRSDRT
jgi:hypothetical protein